MAVAGERTEVSWERISPSWVRWGGETERQLDLSGNPMAVQYARTRHSRVRHRQNESISREHRGRRGEDNQEKGLTLFPNQFGKKSCSGGGALKSQGRAGHVARRRRSTTGGTPSTILERGTTAGQGTFRTQEGGKSKEGPAPMNKHSNLARLCATT